MLISKVRSKNYPMKMMEMMKVSKKIRIHLGEMNHQMIPMKIPLIRRKALQVAMGHPKYQEISQQPNQADVQIKQLLKSIKAALRRTHREVDQAHSVLSISVQVLSNLTSRTSSLSSHSSLTRMVGWTFLGSRSSTSLLSERLWRTNGYLKIIQRNNIINKYIVISARRSSYITIY
jgi:hypothetical protein